jgi:cysteinyl-tRNA synthetase
MYIAINRWATITIEDLGLMKSTIYDFTFDILGLVNVTKAAESTTDKLASAVELLIQLRQEARANKDFALSDKIRDELATKGIQLNDGKEGTTFSTN